MNNFKDFFSNKRKRNITIGVCLCVIIGITTTTIVVLNKNTKPNIVKTSNSKTDFKKVEDEKDTTKDNNKEIADKKTEPTSKESQINKPKKQSLPVKKAVYKSQPTKVKKIVPKNKSNSVKKTVKKKNASITKNKPTTFTSKKLGFSITFPASWENKYIIKQTNDGIYVYYKFKNRTDSYEGFLFTIRDKQNLEYKYEDMYDGVGSRKYFKTKGITYVIGGPLDFAIDPSRSKSERDSFSKLIHESYIALNTLKKIN